MTKLGILRETKSPPDRRVALTPGQCRRLLERHPGLDIAVQPSDIRCFSDDEYSARGIRLAQDLADRDMLLGVKEVEPEALLADKTYCFFSHTAKQQPYNRGLLQEIVRKRIRLVDYEYLDDGKERVVAFGRWAGVVGAYNGLRALGRRSGTFELKPAHRCFDLAEVLEQLAEVRPGRTRVAVTGGGRVANGALEILEAARIRRITPEQYLFEEYDSAVYTRLDPWHYTRRSDGSAFDFGHFVEHPEQYENALLPYAARTDLLMACHFWDPRSPRMLSREELLSGKAPISVIADISCDIGEPIASTVRASTIESPFYGYDPATGLETDPFADGVITVMAVDNLPGELPRDASADFGDALVDCVMPELLGDSDSGMLDRATITHSGRLAPGFAYLQDFLEGK